MEANPVQLREKCRFLFFLILYPLLELVDLLGDACQALFIFGDILLTEGSKRKRKGQKD